MLNYNSTSSQMATVGFPKVFIIDDMTYTLPPAVKKTSYMYILYIVIAVLAYPLPYPVLHSLPSSCSSTTSNREGQITLNKGLSSPPIKIPLAYFYCLIACT